MHFRCDYACWCGVWNRGAERRTNCGYKNGLGCIFHGTMDALFMVPWMHFSWYHGCHSANHVKTITLHRSFINEMHDYLHANSRSFVKHFRLESSCSVNSVVDSVMIITCQATWKWCKNYYSQLNNYLNPKIASFFFRNACIQSNKGRIIKTSSAYFFGSLLKCWFKPCTNKCQLLFFDQIIACNSIAIKWPTECNINRRQRNFNWYVESKRRRASRTSLFRFVFLFVCYYLCSQNGNHILSFMSWVFIINVNDDEKK